LLRKIIEDEAAFRRVRQLVLMLLLFTLCYLVVIAVVIIWRAGDIGMVIEVVLDHVRRGMP
jgi:hypothetical protein